MKSLYDIMLDQKMRRDNFITAVQCGELNAANMDRYHDEVTRLYVLEDKQTKKYIKHLQKTCR